MIKCSKCNKLFTLYIKDIFNVTNSQKFDDIDIYCKDCGLIGTADIEIKISKIKELK